MTDLSSQSEKPKERGRWLKARRKFLILTQEGLAELVGCSDRAIRNYEGGSPIDIGFVDKLLLHLEIPESERTAFTHWLRDNPQFGWQPFPYNWKPSLSHPSPPNVRNDRDEEKTQTGQENPSDALSSITTSSIEGDKNSVATDALEVATVPNAQRKISPIDSSMIRMTILLSVLLIAIVVLWSTRTNSANTPLISSSRPPTVQANITPKVEILVSAVDDEVDVDLNGVRVTTVRFGDQTYWVDVSRFVSRGKNTFTITNRNITGPCVVSFDVKINNQLRNDLHYEYKDLTQNAPNGVCGLTTRSFDI